jgi:ATP-dependent Lhr-like helicase
VPDHPLTNQAISACLHEAMDVDGLERLLGQLEAGAVRVVTCDLTQPSPLALEVLSARPNAFLDDAPLEERRTQAVMARRWHDPRSASELGRLDPEAIARVSAEAWPDPENAEELHDSLLWLSCLTEAEARAAESWSKWLEELTGQKRVARLNTPGAMLWIPAERLGQFRAVWPHSTLQPEIMPPSDQQAGWSRDLALVEILRGRLEGLGPVTQTALAAPLALEPEAAAGALAALESEGAILRGRFVAGVNDEQWCDRRLLARIHHTTIRRLRSEIEPVAARDFLRFLFTWQHVDNDARLEGPHALPSALVLLEGFEAPAASWETEILPARIEGYEPAWLDTQCIAGRSTWARLTSPPYGSRRARAATPVRSTPIALLDRRRLTHWLSLSPRISAPLPSPRAQLLVDCLRTNGAMFFDELAEVSHLLRPQVEDALCELVALGSVTSDSFAGLRALLVPSSRRKPIAGVKRRGRVLAFDIERGGRWALLRRAPRSGGMDEQEKAAATEQVARTLLQRYGVIFWRLLAREAGWLPPWRDLLRIYRRLEARGEIRDGRFVAGFSGEQYALPEAVGLLRETRRKRLPDQWISLSGADPLNLIGVLTPGPRLPALTNNRLIYRDGLPVATLSAGKVDFLTTLDGTSRWEAEKRLMRSAARGLLSHLS